MAYPEIAVLWLMILSYTVSYPFMIYVSDMDNKQVTSMNFFSSWA